jgi:spermidine/putrescine-binding protein
MDTLDRRALLLRGGAALGGALLLAACGADEGLRPTSEAAPATSAPTEPAPSSAAGTTAAAATTEAPASSEAPATTAPPPPRFAGTLEDEQGTLVIAEWPGYEAGGTEAQTYGLLAGTAYVERFGAKGLRYADFGNDDRNLNAMRAGQRFDLLHPCADYVQDYVDAGLVQPFDTSLLPSFGNLRPELVERGRVDGEQYLIPWDWGYGSILYRKDQVDPAHATGWELLFDERYEGRISLWDGGSLPVMLAGILTDPPAADVFRQTADELERSKELLLRQKPLNAFYWTSQYGNQQPAFQSGEIWITYAWPSDYKAMGDALGYDKVGYMNPSQGPFAWLCGFMLGADAESPLHAHEYVESFIRHDAAVNLTNVYAYGSADGTVRLDEIDDQRLAQELRIGDASALRPPVRVQQHIPERAAYQRVWAEVKAS